MAKGYFEAVLAIKPDAQIASEGTAYEGINWLDETPIDKATLDAKLAELPTEQEEMEARKNLKASAKAKLIAGEKLTEEEANVLVGV